MDVMMGDLVLTEDEVNPVMSALLDNGLDVTALHNHFFWDQPRIFYMHVHGHGTAAELAGKLKPAIDLIGKGSNPLPSHPPAAAGAPSAGKINTAKIAQIVGTQGEQTGDVYKITIGRDDLKLTEMGAPINARMGLNTWAAFVGTNDNAAVAGDVAMLTNEVTPVLKALRKNGLDVVAIHHHMVGTEPTILFSITGEPARRRTSRPASRPRSRRPANHPQERPSSNRYRARSLFAKGVCHENHRTHGHHGSHTVCRLERYRQFRQG
jgi:hypothetical protein